VTHKQRVLELLSDGEPHTHLEVYALNVIAHSRIADLRRDGHEINCWRDGDLSYYQLVSLAQPDSHSSPTGAGGWESGGANDDAPSLFQIPASVPGAYTDGLAA
jgi:hypothetical protein